MWRIPVIFSLLSVIVILGIWMQIEYSGIRKHKVDFINEDPFDNFQYFNDLDEIEENNACVPFIIGPRQSDTLEFVSPMIFSCNSPMENWANFSNGILTIHEKLVEKRKKGNNINFTCVYTEIVASEELLNGTLLVESSKNETSIEPGTPTEIHFEQFVVFCREPSGNHFYNKTFFNFMPKMQINPRKRNNETNGIMVLSVSGMSHNQGMRHLKQFLKFASQSDFRLFSLFNQESRNNWNNSINSFGALEKVWNLAKKGNSCPTFLHTDSPEFSKTFGNQFDYHSNLYHYFNKQYLGHVDNCISDGSVTVEDAVTLWINFTQTFQHHPCHFSLLHLTEISAPEDGKIVNLDEILRISLEKLLENGILENTTVIILSDGGSKNNFLYDTESGKIESKYGLFMIRLADNFRRKYSQEAENLKKNVDRFITNTDVFKTIKSLIAKGNDSERKELNVSLLDREVPRDRVCEDVGIVENSCFCSKSLVLKEEKRKEVLDELLKVVKKEVSGYKCLSKIEFLKNDLKFRNFGFINFFRFRGFLTTEKVKLSEKEGYSNSTKLLFYGKARFSTSDRLNLELREPLKLVKSSESINSASDNCYRRIIQDFKNNG